MIAKPPADLIVADAGPDPTPDVLLRIHGELFAGDS